MGYWLSCTGIVRFSLKSLLPGYKVVLCHKLGSYLIKNKLTQMTFKSNFPQVCSFSSVLSIKLYGEHQLKLPSLLGQIKSLKLISCLGNFKLKSFRKYSEGFKAVTEKFPGA